MNMAAAGSSNCPYCNEAIAESPELPFGSIECPHCDGHLWFLTLSNERAYFRHEAAALVQRLFEGLTEQLRVPPELGLDDLDVVELIVTFESELAEAI